MPEVEILVRHLGPLLHAKTVRRARVLRAKVLAPTSLSKFVRTLRGARFCGVRRRGKYLVFTLKRGKSAVPLTLVGHLGMTGRMYMLPADAPLPKHAAVVLDLGGQEFVFEDTRYFGRLTLDQAALARLGPEPLSGDFTSRSLARDLKRSRQPIKLKLLDQGLVAGIGNIYASEALFRAGISPFKRARRLSAGQVTRLWRAIREVLRNAVAGGSTVPLDYSGAAARDRLFYFGRGPGTPDYYEERLRVYDREGLPCGKCGTAIRRSVQGARSTFYCPRCQRG